eukprot:510199-Amorphochlora_amoeboformis.AAC.1
MRTYKQHHWTCVARNYLYSATELWWVFPKSLEIPGIGQDFTAGSVGWYQVVPEFLAIPYSKGRTELPNYQTAVLTI